jgi:hypothetical protein
MARGPFLTEIELKKVWCQLCKEYDCIAFRVEQNVESSAVAVPRCSAEAPYEVVADASANFHYDSLVLPKDADKILTPSDRPAWFAFVLLHEVGHHKLGHSTAPCRRDCVAQREADYWAVSEYNRLQLAGLLPTVEPAKLKAFARIARCYEP